MFTAYVKPRGPVIRHSGLQYHMYADNTQLPTSDPACQFHRLFVTTQQTRFCQALLVEEQITDQRGKKRKLFRTPAFALIT